MLAVECDQGKLGEEEEEEGGLWYVEFCVEEFEVIESGLRCEGWR